MSDSKTAACADPCCNPEPEEAARRVELPILRDPGATIREAFDDLVAQLNERLDAQAALNEALAGRLDTQTQVIIELAERVRDLEVAALGKPLEEVT
jgi:hypothetical protein